MFRKFCLFFTDSHHIVVFSMYQDRLKSHLSQDVNQFATAIPRIKGDWIFSKIHLRIKEIQYFFEHRNKTGGFIRIASPLFADKTHIQRNIDFSNLDSDAIFCPFTGWFAVADHQL